MKAAKHKIKHYYQSSNDGCGYAALAILLSHYGFNYQPKAVMQEVSQPKDEKGKDTGSVTAQLVSWCQKLGLKTHMYSFDCMVLDLSWKKLSKDKLLAQLKAVRNIRNAPAFGKHWSKVYIDAYISMLEAGAKLTIQPHVTSKLLYKLLKNGPVYANICSTVRRGEGRKHNAGLRKSVIDDVKGAVTNHSIVIYGNDAKGNFLVADPWDGFYKTDPEQMVAIITAAQIECDNQVFVIEE